MVTLGGSQAFNFLILSAVLRHAPAFAAKSTPISLPYTFAVGQPQNYTFRFKNTGSQTATGVSIQSSNAANIITSGKRNLLYLQLIR